MRKTLLASVPWLLLAGSASACDLCAVYSAQLAHAQGASGWYAGISEQYSRYDELRSGGDRIDEDGGQYLKSSITQLFLGYGLSDRWSLQLNVPLIDRSYLRLEHDGAADRGSESGLGDVSVLAQFLAVQRMSDDSTFNWRLLAGLKLATGDSDRLAEELDEDHHGALKHDDGIPSGVHGHDLALGSGSTDVLLGSTLSGRQGLWLYGAELQYAWRTEGDYDYQVGNDLQWALAAGRYLALDDDHSWSLQLRLTGEHKRFDELSGERMGDTRQRTLALGPQLAATWGARQALEIGFELPLDQDVSEVQITQGWRMRAAWVTRF